MIYKQSQQQAKTRFDTREPEAKAGDGIKPLCASPEPLCAGRSGDLLGEHQHLFEQGDHTLDEVFFAAAVESMDDAALRKVTAQTLQAMRRLELVPRRATQNRMARAFQRSLPEDVAEAFWTLHSEGGALGKIAHTALMVAFERSKPERTLVLYKELSTAGITPTRVIYNSALCAMCQLSRADEALALFKKMSELGEADPAMVPNGKSYGSVLHVCAGSGKQSMALRIFDCMVSQGILPNRFAYNDAIVSCMRLRKLNQAMLLYEQMRARGVSPCDNTHRILIRACCTRGLTKEHAYLVEQFKMVKLAEVGAEITESEASSDFREPSMEGNSE